MKPEEAQQWGAYLASRCIKLKKEYELSKRYFSNMDEATTPNEVFQAVRIEKAYENWKLYQKIIEDKEMSADVKQAFEAEYKRLTGE